MRIVRLVAIFVTIACIMAGLASCSSQSSDVAKAKEKPRVVGVSLLTEEHPFYRELKAAFIDECEVRNIRPIILSCNMDLATQTNQVENFINQGVDAIVICPAKSGGIAGAIRKANNAKIPVFTADIAAQGGDVVAHIASDNVEGGRLAGEYMAKMLDSKGNVAIINYPEVQSVQDRVKGFKEAIAKYPGIKIVDDQAAQGKRDVAVTVAENILQKHQKLNGIFAINDSSALGALAAIEQAGRNEIVLIGYDGDPEARQKILAGSALKADAVQFPRKIGSMTAVTVADYLDGKNVEAVIPVEVGIIDQASLRNERE